MVKNSLLSKKSTEFYDISLRFAQEKDLQPSISHRKTRPHNLSAKYHD